MYDLSIFDYPLRAVQKYQISRHTLHIYKKYFSLYSPFLGQCNGALKDIEHLYILRLVLGVIRPRLNVHLSWSSVPLSPWQQGIVKTCYNYYKFMSNVFIMIHHIKLSHYCNGFHAVVGRKNVENEIWLVAPRLKFANIDRLNWNWNWCMAY